LALPKTLLIVQLNFCSKQLTTLQIDIHNRISHVPGTNNINYWISNLPGTNAIFLFLFRQTSSSNFTKILPNTHTHTYYTS